MLDRWRPDAVCFSGNYLANVPEIVDLAKATKARLPSCFVFVGGHSVSFVARHVLDHADGAIHARAETARAGEEDVQGRLLVHGACVAPGARPVGVGG